MGKAGKNSCIFTFKQINLIYDKIHILYGKKCKIHLFIMCNQSASGGYCVGNKAQKKDTVKKIKFTYNQTLLK